MAEERFRRVCFGSFFNPSMFVGPTRSGIGGGGFAYEWKDTTPGRDFVILITVDESGYTNVSFLGHLPGF